MKKLEKLASKLAHIAHYGQYRNDGVTPYIIHPKAVAKSVKDERMKAVAWLHDVIEDTNVRDHHLREQEVPEDVIEAVQVMTKLPCQNYLEYILRCKKNYLACHVKIADITHNLSTLEKNKKDKRDKYELALFILKS